MALNHLTIAEMVNSTTGWIEPGSQTRAAFLAVESLAPLVPKLEDALAGLLGIQRVALDGVVAQLSRKRKAVDQRHDGLQRAVYRVIEGYLELAHAVDDHDSIEALETLRESLFPYDLEIVNFSYAEEAGQAELLASRMTPEMEQELAAIPMKSGNLLDLVRAWIQAGAELARLEVEVAETERPSQRGPVMQARGRWMGVIRAIRNVASLEDSLDGTVERALHQVTMAEAAAARRGSGEVDASTDEEPVVSEPSGTDEEPVDVEPGTELENRGQDIDDESSPAAAIEAEASAT